MPAPVCLTMIVKDEAHCIETALVSALGWIDRWVVVDTGSTDATQEVVRRVLRDVPGELHERAWVDFATNRNQALDLARAGARPGEYALSLDADDHLEPRGAARSWPELSAAGYALEIGDADLRYHRTVLVALDREWRWVGVRHEALVLDATECPLLDVVGVVRERTGARSRDPSTYRSDAEALAQELLRRPDDARTQFYLAQSWRDAGEEERALAAYRRRAANPHGWDQERWYAGFQAALLMERLAAPTDRVVAALLDAFQERPSRAEPLVEAARIERCRDRPEVALLYAARAVEIAPPPPTDLFVDTAALTWRAWDEYAVSAWAGNYLESGETAARRALDLRPDDPRLQANLDHFTRVRAERD